MAKLPLSEHQRGTDIAISVNELYDLLYYVNPFYNDSLGAVEPPTRFKRDGFLAYANGTTWNPGSGKGLYRWNATSSAWVFVG